MLIIKNVSSMIMIILFPRRSSKAQSRRVCFLNHNQHLCSFIASFLFSSEIKEEEKKQQRLLFLSIRLIDWTNLKKKQSISAYYWDELKTNRY